jgi:hypothetical protein
MGRWIDRSWVLSLALAGCARPSSDDVSTHGTPEPDPSASPLERALVRAWADAGVVPAEVSGDAEYLRRVTLDLVGRVPTPDEVADFLEDDDPERRARLVDRLLAEDAWAETWAGAWSGRLVARGVGNEREAESAFRAWLAEELRSDVGWDEIVSQLLTVTGELAQHPEGIALASQLRRGDEAAAVGSLSRDLLGVQIECAQCHDHPYDSEFTRDDFWATAAFFARARVRRVEPGKKRQFTIVDTRRGETRIKADDGITDRVIAPRFLGAEGDGIRDSETRREAFARALIRHPNFPRATAGLVWSRMFGRGIVDPWDSLPLWDPPPRLLDALADRFVEHDHRLRALVREVALSSAYQRTSKGDAGDRHASESVFARASVRPLPAEALFASLLVATGLEDVRGRAFKQAVKSRKVAAAKEYSFVFPDDEAAIGDGFSGNVPQALLLLNGMVTNQGARARAGGRLRRVLDADSNPAARVRALIRVAYAREPSEAELAEHLAWLSAQSEAGDGPDAAYEDLFFAMLGSAEFTTNH